MKSFRCRDDGEMYEKGVTLTGRDARIWENCAIIREFCFADRGRIVWFANRLWIVWLADREWIAHQGLAFFPARTC